MLLFKDVSNTSGSGVVKDVDVKTGTITGYFSVFGNVDSDGDIILPGAFARSLSNNYKRMRHLWQHSTHQPLAGTKNERLVIKEDSKGLYFESKISQTTLGKDVVLLYQDGVIDEHSIGFEIVKQRDHDTLTHMRWGQKVPVKEIHEVKLWEGSSVTWGANSKAGTESVKSLTKEQSLDKMNQLLKALRNGTYETEEIFEMIEYQFKQLEAQILTPCNTRPEDQNSPDSRKDAKQSSLDSDMILSLLKLKNKSLIESI